MTQKITASIVIPNWNGLDLLKKHLKHILTAVGGSEIIVSDDASVDGSVAWLRDNFPKVQIVENKIRRGFATNVNRAVAVAKGDIVVLLNTDVIPEKEFLGPLLKHFENPNVFAVGCLEKSYENGEIILRGRGEARWRKGLFIHRRGEIDKKDTAWVSGGAGAFNRTLWNELGGMDPLYDPFYWEDIDLSYRALKAGYTLIFEKQSIVGHYHEKGKIRSEFSPSDIKRIAYRNQFLFILKNLSDIQQMFLFCLLSPFRLLRALYTGDLLMTQGYISAISKMPQLLLSRNRASRMWRKSDNEIVHI